MTYSGSRSSARSACDRGLARAEVSAEERRGFQTVMAELRASERAQRASERAFCQHADRTCGDVAQSWWLQYVITWRVAADAAFAHVHSTADRTAPASFSNVMLTR